MSDSHDSHAPASSGDAPVPRKVPGGITRGRLAVIVTVILALAVFIVGITWKSDDASAANKEVSNKDAYGVKLATPPAPPLPVVPDHASATPDCPEVPAMGGATEGPKANVVPARFYKLRVETMQLGEVGWVKVGDGTSGVATCAKRFAWVTANAEVLTSIPAGEEQSYVMLTRTDRGYLLDFGQRASPLPMIRGPEGAKPGDKIAGWVRISDFAPPRSEKG